MTHNRKKNHINKDKRTMRIKVLLMSLLLAAVSQVMAQSTGQVGGRVLNEYGEPVIGAQVKLKGKNVGTVTDLNGEFVLPKAKPGETLVITYIGMETTTIKAAAKMKISMHTQESELDEVIVVAFGEQKKSSFTGSAGVVKGDQLEKNSLPMYSVD